MPKHSSNSAGKHKDYSGKKTPKRWESMTNTEFSKRLSDYLVNKNLFTESPWKR